MKSSRGPRSDHEPDQQVADETHKIHRDDEMPKVPADDRIQQRTSEQGVLGDAQNVINAEVEQIRATSRPDPSRDCAEKETDHRGEGQDPSDSATSKVPGLRGAKTSRWHLTTETVTGP